jgi:hypothetical protein
VTSTCNAKREEEAIALLQLKLRETEKIRRRQEEMIAELTKERDEINRKTRDSFEKLPSEGDEREDKTEDRE